MNEFESTLQVEAPTSQTTAVFDSRNGRIVYTHEFIGGGSSLFRADGQSERERIALEAAQRHGHDTGDLRVLHLPAGFRFEHDKLYRVDPKAGTVIVHACVTAHPLHAKQSGTRKT
jgi:hypothetical protein